MSNAKVMICQSYREKSWPTFIDLVVKQKKNVKLIRLGLEM